MVSVIVLSCLGKVVTEPKSSQMVGLFCTFFHDTAEILTSAVCQLDIPMPEKDKTVVRPSTKDSQSTITQPVMPQMDPSATSSSDKVRECATVSMRFVL